MVVAMLALHRGEITIRSWPLVTIPTTVIETREEDLCIREHILWPRRRPFRYNVILDIFVEVEYLRGRVANTVGSVLLA